LISVGGACAGALGSVKSGPNVKDAAGGIVAEERIGGMSARVLVVGLDAGDPGTVRKLAATGRMPTLARLLKSGAQYPMSEPRGGAYIAERWTTMVTGVGPEIHRYYCWAAGGAPAPLDPARIKRFWDVVSSEGYRVAVIDVPRQPLSEINGIQLCEWATHDRDEGTRSWPPELAAEIEARFGPYPFAVAARNYAGQFVPCDVILRTGHDDRTLDQLRELKTLVRDSLELKARVSEHLLESEPWDLFFTVIAESHCATHHFWHLHDPASDHDREFAAALGDVVAETFERIDAILARHVQLAGPESTTVVVLHSGMAPLSGGNGVLREVVKRLAGPSRLFSVCTFTNRIGTIRLRLEGRDRRGTVPHHTGAGVVDRLTTELLQLVDDDTGSQAVRAVRTRAEVFPGLEDDTLPDIFVEWQGQHLIRSVSSPTIGTVTAKKKTARTGDHTAEGLVIVRGPGIVPQVHSTMDPMAFAPLVCGLIGGLRSTLGLCHDGQL
jgi:predicted AlkP superfamily phosphohydrolase/phosphomutase